MYLIQIILIIFFLFAIVKTAGRARAKDLSSKLAAGWIILWLGGIVVVMFPNSTFPIARFFGVGRGVDFVVYVSLALLFFGVFRLLVAVERLEREVTLLTRALALKSENLIEKK